MADYKKITKFEKHKESPFIDELLEIDVTHRKRLLASKDPSLVVNPTTGEIEGTQMFAILEKVDREKFTKVYERGITQMFNLSKSGIKVFGYFTQIAKPNKDDVIFEMDNCKDFTEYKTDKPILKGLAELIENGFIARSKYHYRYYINPTMFFNGNRVAFIKMYQLEAVPTEQNVRIKTDKNNLLE